MSAFSFSRWRKQLPRPARHSTRHRSRLAVEALEERMLMNNRSAPVELGRSHAALTCARVEGL